MNPHRLFVHHRQDGSIAKIEYTNAPTPVADAQMIAVPHDPALCAVDAGQRYHVRQGQVVRKPDDEQKVLDRKLLRS